MYQGVAGPTGERICGNRTIRSSVNRDITPLPVNNCAFYQPLPRCQVGEVKKRAFLRSWILTRIIGHLLRVTEALQVSVSVHLQPMFCSTWNIYLAHCFVKNSFCNIFISLCLWRPCSAESIESMLLLLLVSAGTEYTLTFWSISHIWKSIFSKFCPW